MIRNNDIIQGYTVLMVANGMVLAHSETAPDPYVVWHTAENGNDVRYLRQTALRSLTPARPRALTHGR